MDSGRPIYRQRVQKKSAEANREILTKVKTRHRDHQKWMQGVRFTPRGFEKQAARQFEASRQKSELGLGTIKNGFRASDLPPEGPTKRAPRQFERFEQNSKFWSKLAVGGPSKMDSAHPIYSQRVRKKSAKAI